MRLVIDDTLFVRGRECEDALGGELDSGVPPADGEEMLDVPSGNDNRYQPPLYVSAMSWNSIGGSRPGSLRSEGASIQPTMHFSSSVISAVGEREDDVEEDNDMWEACAGIRY